MLKDIIAVQPLDNYHLHLQFEDGIEGVVDVKQLIEFTGIFEPLNDLDYFAQVRVHPDLGTVCWDNDADLDPIVLYAAVTNRSVEDILSVPEAVGN